MKKDLIAFRRYWSITARRSIGIEFTVNSHRNFSISARRDYAEGAEWIFGLCLLGIHLYVILTGFYTIPADYKYEDEARELSIRVFDWAIWWCLWRNDAHCHSTDKRQGSWYPLDTLLGSLKSKTVQKHQHDATLSMPESDYPCSVTMELVRWKRKRWFAFYRHYANVVVEFPIPIPGKGENGWDCDDDAVYEASFNVGSVEEALDKVRSSVLKTRMDRGGLGWMPQ